MIVPILSLIRSGVRLGKVTEYLFSISSLAGEFVGLSLNLDTGLSENLEAKEYLLWFSSCFLSDEKLAEYLLLYE
jgi:hypothetical protein